MYHVTPVPRLRLELSQTRLSLSLKENHRVLPTLSYRIYVNQGSRILKSVTSRQARSTYISEWSLPLSHTHSQLANSISQTTTTRHTRSHSLHRTLTLFHRQLSLPPLLAYTSIKGLSQILFRENLNSINAMFKSTLIVLSLVASSFDLVTATHPRFKNIKRQGAVLAGSYSELISARRRTRFSEIPLFFG